jgi:hypothetical protein
VMLDHVGIMAEPGAAFNPVDVGSGPHHRFLRAGSYGNTLFVWYEHGGLGYHRHVAFFSPVASSDPPSTSLRPFMLGSFVSEDLCAATKAFIIGVRPAAQNDW